MTYILRQPDIVAARFGEHLLLTFVSLAIALAIAFPLGVLAARRPRAGAVTLAILNVIYTIPSLALLAILVAFFGLGMPTAIVALVAYAQMILVRNVAEGLRGVSPAALDAADGLGFTPLRRLLQIEIPLALPAIVGGDPHRDRRADRDRDRRRVDRRRRPRGAGVRRPAPRQRRQDRRRQLGRGRARARRRRHVPARSNGGRPEREPVVRLRNAARCGVPASVVRAHAAHAPGDAAGLGRRHRRERLPDGRARARRTRGRRPHRARRRSARARRCVGRRAELRAGADRSARRRGHRGGGIRVRARDRGDANALPDGLLARHDRAAVLAQIVRCRDDYARTKSESA